VPDPIHYQGPIFSRVAGFEHSVPPMGGGSEIFQIALGPESFIANARDNGHRVSGEPMSRWRRRMAARAPRPGYQAELQYGIVAPAGTPAPVLGRLNKALNTALADAAVQGRLAGAETLPGTPAAYAADIASERARWSALLKQSDTAGQ
jgi:hypothetical protein